MSKANEDPFYAVRDDVNRQVEKVKIKFEQYKEVLRTVDTSTSVEFKELRKSLGRDVRRVEKDVEGLKGAVNQIEKNRSKFPHVKDQELLLRKKFVTDTQEALYEIKQSMDSPAVRRKIEEDEIKHRRGQADDMSGAMSSGNPGLENENAAFIANQTGRTHQMIAQQDVHLSGLDEAVGRLDHMGRTINEELKDQNRMLGQLDDDLSEAQSKMNFVMASLSKLLKTKDGCQLWTIAILCLILVILVALVIWT